MHCLHFVPSLERLTIKDCPEDKVPALLSSIESSSIRLVTLEGDTIMSMRPHTLEAIDILFSNKDLPIGRNGAVLQVLSRKSNPIGLEEIYPRHLPKLVSSGRLELLRSTHKTQLDSWMADYY